jgi:FAD/FMN-containing dehydrogenase
MFKTRKRPVLASFVFAGIAFLLILAKKVFDYAAPPAGPKDCNFVFPSTAANQTKPTFILAVLSKPWPSMDQRGGYINDASCLNKTAIYGTVKVHNVDDIRTSLKFARENHMKVTAAGMRHSMGGQSFAQDGLVLDMREFNRLKLDREHKVLTAETGATWEQIQRFLDPQGLSLQAMQSINIFTVGGTMSVNAHGIAHRPGPLAGTVMSFRIMLADGQIQTASPSENPELFRMALGGYGLFGVLLDVDLQLTDNHVYQLNTQYMNYRDFPAYYREHIDGKDDVGLIYGRLSVAPDSYLRETAVHVYTEAQFDGPPPAMQPSSHDWLERLVINFSKTGGLGRRVRWNLEKSLQPRIQSCISRNQAMNQKEPCLVTRNQEMYDAMGYLKNRLQDTDILQEYFLPPDKMPAFVDGLREIVTKNGANLLNITIRVVHQDNITALPYARQDMFAFVLYFNQKLNEKESRSLQNTTMDLVDLALGLEGTYYLPYQLYYSPQQLRRAYPGIEAFFKAKERYDPAKMFSNKFYEKYGPKDNGA